MWERELRKLKGLYDNRLRASQQKSSKMEQALTNQTYQVTLIWITLIYWVLTVYCFLNSLKMSQWQLRVELKNGAVTHLLNISGNLKTNHIDLLGVYLIVIRCPNDNTKTMKHSLRCQTYQITLKLSTSIGWVIRCRYDNEQKSSNMEQVFTNQIW
jgi:hypothetical protein